VHRRAYVLLIGVATLMGGLALLTSVGLDKRLVDPEGFLGPSWLRLPLLLLGALLLDMLPRAIWQSKLHPAKMWPIVRERWDEHWNRERITLVVLGLVCFYITYVSYRNLKSFLPEAIGLKDYDRPLHLLDQAIFFGNEPALVLHDLLGSGLTAHFLSTIYLWFLPMVPLVLTGWLIWSNNISFGYWFATSQCLAWSLGTASYYALPTTGPGFEYAWLYEDLDNTGASQLMDSLYNGRPGADRRRARDHRAALALAAGGARGIRTWGDLAAAADAEEPRAPRQRPPRRGGGRPSAHARGANDPPPRAARPRRRSAPRAPAR
jgi:hypothetical protein